MWGFFSTANCRAGGLGSSEIDGQILKMPSLKWLSCVTCPVPSWSKPQLLLSHAHNPHCLFTRALWVLLVECRCFYSNYLHVLRPQGLKLVSQGMDRVRWLSPDRGASFVASSQARCWNEWLRPISSTFCTFSCLNHLSTGAPCFVPHIAHRRPHSFWGDADFSAPWCGLFLFPTWFYNSKYTVDIKDSLSPWVSFKITKPLKKTLRLECFSTIFCQNFFKIWLHWGVCSSIHSIFAFRIKHRKNCECCPGHYLSTSVY